MDDWEDAVPFDLGLPVGQPEVLDADDFDSSLEVSFVNEIPPGLQGVMSLPACLLDEVVEAEDEFPFLVTGDARIYIQNAELVKQSWKHNEHSGIGSHVEREDYTWARINDHFTKRNRDSEDGYRLIEMMSRVTLLTMPTDPDPLPSTLDKVPLPYYPAPRVYPVAPVPATQRGTLGGWKRLLPVDPLVREPSERRGPRGGWTRPRMPVDFTIYAGPKKRRKKRWLRKLPPPEEDEAGIVATPFFMPYDL